jgi:hypothetical protein
VEPRHDERNVVLEFFRGGEVADVGIDGIVDRADARRRGSVEDGATRSME